MLGSPNHVTLKRVRMKIREPRQDGPSQPNIRHPFAPKTHNHPGVIDLKKTISKPAFRPKNPRRQIPRHLHRSRR